MRITVLGTGTSQGVPVIACNCSVCRSHDPRDHRGRSSVYIEAAGLRLVIDTGPDFREQVLREAIDRLDAVLLTHEHRDHTAGLDELRSYNFAWNMIMPVYASASVHATLKSEFAYAFASDPYPGVPSFDLRVIDGMPFNIGELEIIPVQAIHLHLPVFGFRIGKFAYLTDLSHIDDTEKLKLKDLDVLILSALHKDPHYSHFNLDQALSLIAEVKPERAFLTHISHQMGLHAKVEASLPVHVKLAFDGLKIEISGTP